MKISFRGNVRKCLEHCSQINDGEYSLSKLMAEFTGASYEGTVRHWLKVGDRGYLPHGEYFVKVAYFLDVMGYQVEELAELPEAVYGLGKCIAFGLISVEESVKKTNYKKASNLYAVLRGKHVAKEDRQALMAECFKGYEAELVKVSNQWRQRIEAVTAKNTKSPLSEENNQGQLFRQGSKALMVNEREEVIRSLGVLLQGALPLARLISTDSFSPEDREKVRELAGRDTVLHFTNALVKLSGERARENAISRESRAL